MLATIAATCRDYRQPILVEEFVDGDELTVGVLGNDPPTILGIMRVLPRAHRGPFVYSVEVKRNWRELVDYECPAKLSAQHTAAVERAALACWHAFGCRDCARIDFRLRNGEPVFLEANPLPGLTPGSSDLVLLAGSLGIDYTILVGRILDAAITRLASNSRASA